MEGNEPDEQEIDENAQPLGQRFNYNQQQNENINGENVYAANQGLVGGGFQGKQIQNNMQFNGEQVQGNRLRPQSAKTAPTQAQQMLYQQ